MESNQPELVKLHGAPKQDDTTDWRTAVPAIALLNFKLEGRGHSARYLRPGQITKIEFERRLGTTLSFPLE